MANTNPELKKMLMKYPLDEIEQAQALLREKAYMEVKKMSKEEIHNQCKMSKFD